jgi:hypothetical protein
MTSMASRLLLASVLLLPLGASAAASCPATFEAFIARFERSQSFQQAHTRYPLRYAYVDKEAQPEPRAIQAWVTRAKAARSPGVRFPSPERQRAIPFDRKTSTGNDGVTVVRFDQPDTDHSLEFRFRRAAGCWQLLRVDDLSL